MSGHFDDTTVERLRQLVRDDVPDDSRYRIAEQIGQGGMGAVYRADDLALNRPVAMKVLRDGCMNADSVDRILREAQVIARLEHPGIVPVHDAGRLPDGRVYYIMKLVKGRRLDEYADSPASIHERLRVFERVCETVAFAHARRVIHRDLKPQNVMVGEFGEVLVLDWGVAKVVHEPMGDDPSIAADSLGSMGDARQTAYGTILGTPAYMPPEQARGEVERIDERSDVFALGGVLYFMLTGKPPRTTPGNAAAELVLVPPRQLNREIPRRLESICTKALSAEPEQRYASAAELSADIVRYLNGQAVLAHREGLHERVAR
ncbi:MAG: serine/threonine-protein kinase, partial [Phycisphaerales bacterium]|nr:serine/threonine-protein kinase [Phycisphaerales bacterium]